MNILIFDDYSVITQSLAKNLNNSICDCNILLCYNNFEAMNVAGKYNIDLFIIDIDEFTRMNFAKRIRQYKNYYVTWMILLAKKSMYNNVDVFRETHCYHYIVKPYSVQDLIFKIKYLLRFEIKERDVDHHLYLCKKYRDILYRIDINTIAYIEINAKDIQIITNLETYDLKNLTLKKISDLLPATFVQCHKSYIVNITKVKNVEYADKKAFLNLGPDMGKIPVGGKYMSCLKDRVQFL